MTTLIWLKNDLRLIDSRSVALALGERGDGDVIVVRARDGTPGHVDPTARRLEVEAKHLAAMRPILDAAGLRLIDASDSMTIVPLAKSLGADTVVSNIEVSEDIGFASDRRVARDLRAAGIRFVETADSGIMRGRSNRTPPADFVTGARDLPPLRFDAAPEPLTALRAYLRRLPFAHYRRAMWLPGPDANASSRLSIDLACGALSGDRVIHETYAMMRGCDPRSLPAYRQFVSRLEWRRSFIQTLEDSVDAFPWAPVREERPEDAARMRAWLNGETGYPLVDAAMRDLVTNGWVNFRLRQLVCSFALDLLDLDMHEVGVALGSLFDDYCPGIHWPQIGLQAGMARGRGPRVLNPIKQAIELDPRGAYVRRMLPETKNVPDPCIHEPWDHASYRGPPRIIDYKTATKAARERHPAPIRHG
jgi:deoxyribodipyrimidine photo-lyase